MLPVLDSRIRFARATGLPLEAFEHANPAWPSRDGLEPEKYVTWRDEGGGVVSFPRGGAGRLRPRLEPGFQDLRTWRHPRPDFPEHR